MVKFPASAFASFFDETVVVTGISRGVPRSQSLKVAIFDDATVDGIIEDALDSDVEQIRCVARENDWLFVRDGMTRGDKIIREDGREYKVVNISKDAALGWMFAARKIK